MGLYTVYSLYGPIQGYRLYTVYGHIPVYTLHIQDIGYVRYMGCTPLYTGLYTGDIGYVPYTRI